MKKPPVPKKKSLVEKVALDKHGLAMNSYSPCSL